MATEYSLLTWAGLGTTVTFTDVGDIVNFTAHGAPAGHAFRFTTTGALPTGLTADTTYYLRPGADANKFTIHPTQADAIAGTNQITFTGTGSGTNQVVGEYWSALGVDGRARYGTAGSERCFGTFSAWTAYAISVQTFKNSAVLEIEGKWAITHYQSVTALNGYYSIKFTTKINGQWGSGYHGGQIGGGFIWQGAAACARTDNLRTVFEGLEMRGNILPITTGTTVIHCIVGPATTGIQVYSSAHTIAHNLIHSCSTCGVDAAGESVIYNNTLIGNGTGIKGGGGRVIALNNVAFGNTADWGAQPTTGYFSNNAGSVASPAWVSVGSSKVDITAADFGNYVVPVDATSDFSPAGDTASHTSSSLLVDACQQEFEVMEASDLKASVRPSYKNGSATDWDIGAYEFDWGYGNIPNLQDYTINGITANHRIKVTRSVGGAVLYNDIPGATSLTISVDCGTADVGVNIHARCGTTAPFFYPIDTTGTISYLSGGSITLQPIPDIARGATYPAGVATDWSVNTGTGAITHVSGTTRYTVQDLYSWLCNYYDDSTTIDLGIPLYGTTPTVFGLQNGGSIADADMEFLKGGSIQDGTTLWANVYTVGTQAAGTPIYVHIDGVEYASFWSTGNIDVLLKLPLYDGTEVVDIRAHNYTDTYDHWSMTVTDGHNVAAISTSDDPDNQTLSATVAGWTDITVTVNNPIGKQIDAADTPANYTTTINGGGRPVAEVYERLKYLTAYPSTYVSANAAFAEVKPSPYGTLSAGVFSGAKGIWLENVATADALNYILTDNAGVTHQAAAPPVSLTVTNIVTGSRLQLYDLTAGTELYNGIVAGTSHSLLYTYPGTDHDIRTRISYVFGTTAKQWYETQGTATSTGMNLRADQVDDTVYNAIGVDGSTVTECAIVGTALTVNVDDPDNVTSAQRIYAFECYWLFTEGGIRDQELFIAATDSTHFVFEGGLKIKNMDTLNPLNITGANIVPTTGNATDVFDLSNGASIALNFNRVEGFAYSSGSGLSPEEHNKLLAIPTESAGLTTEEHNQLMNTLTVPKFIGLK